MITTEENDFASGGSEHHNTKDEFTKSFEVILKDLPEVLHYIKRLNDHIRRQQTTIVKLFEKLKELNAKSSDVANVSTQTEDFKYHYWKDSIYDTSQTSIWNGGVSESIADEVKQAAECAMQQTGFVYEASSGLYYDYNTGYYYNAELGLYYDGTSGTYVYYNEETKQFDYHSQAALPTPVETTQEATIASSELKSLSNTINLLEAPPPPPPPESPSAIMGPQDGKRSSEEDTSERKRRRVSSSVDGQESPEDGEITDSSDSNDEWDPDQNLTVETNWNDEDNEEDISEKESDSPPPTPPGETSSRFPEDSLAEFATPCAPCIRVIVQKTCLSNLKVGALFIVTCTGGTLGRETRHAVCIPDINISKHHATFTFDDTCCKYYVTDLGSRNGTILDGQRLSSAKQESEPHEVNHGSLLQLGSTTLLCHIHCGNETCADCEPGVVSALNATTDHGAEPAALVVEPKGSQHKQELRRLRKKFGLAGAEAAAEMVAAACPAGYEDRAQNRRQTVGSVDDNAKTEVASVDQHIKSSNKGFKMLSKMGWVQGQALGKVGAPGTSAEPISVTQRPEKAGLGVDLDTLPPEVSDRVKRKADVWRKVQQRYSELPTEPPDTKDE